MNADLKKNKAIIRDFMRAQYTDAKLVQLLDHARAGKLAWNTCCCFVGIPTADHELQPHLYRIPEIVRVQNPLGAASPHYRDALLLVNARAAELAYERLSPKFDCERDNNTSVEIAAECDGDRIRILIPMILAEIRRRRKVAQPVAPPLAKVRA